MKRASFTILMILLVTILSACTKAEAPLPTAVEEAPALEATTGATEAPTQVTSAPDQPAVDSPAPQQPPPASPTIDGRELLESRCVSCHSLDRVTTKTGTADEWGEIVTRMIAKGANLTAEEKSILVQYLAETYKK